MPGEDGREGTSGQDGRDGTNGTDGKDGASVYIKGSVDTAADLPETGGETAGLKDAYITKDDGHLWVWEGTEFIDVGQIQGPVGAPGHDGRDGTDGKNGASVYVKGSKASVADLPATGGETEGLVDAWLVAGDLYVWDMTNNIWVNVGRIQGEKGEDGEQGIQGEKGDKGDPAETVTVTFDSDGGPAVGSETVLKGGKITPPQGITKVDPTLVAGLYRVTGSEEIPAAPVEYWMDEDDTPWDFNKTVDADMTLKAKWGMAEAIYVEEEPGNNLAEKALAYVGHEYNRGRYLLWLNTDVDVVAGSFTLSGSSIIIASNTGEERTITRNDHSDSNGTMFTLSGANSKITLGKGITMKGRDDVVNAAGFVNIQNGEFVMEEGSKLTNFNTNAANAAVVNLTSNGKFTMNGGEISGNTGASGVSLAGNATFTMNDGEISGNSGPYGVNITAAGNTFTMNGGTISGNTDMTNVIRLGAAGTLVMGEDVVIKENQLVGDNTRVVYIAGGTATIGGSITDNELAGNNTSALYIANGTVAINGTVSGHELSGNNNGAVYIANGTVTINGDIIDNKVVADNTSDSVIMGAVYMANGTVMINGSISDNELVPYSGVTVVNYLTAGVYQLAGAVTLNGEVKDNTARYGVRSASAAIATSVTLTMNDGALISGNGDNTFEEVANNGAYAFVGGTGVFFGNSAPGSRFTMNGGTITGHNSTINTQAAGGVWIDGPNTVNLGTTPVTAVAQTATFFDMKGGTISGNTATGSTVLAGGVYLRSRGNLFYNPGSGNVQVSKIIMTMSGGTITGNTATSTSNSLCADGVCFYANNAGTGYAYARLIMTGGSITGNTGSWGDVVNSCYNVTNLANGVRTVEPGSAENVWGLSLSGDATVGAVTMVVAETVSATNYYLSTMSVDPDWTGTVSKLNLYSNTALNNLPALWMMTGTANTNIRRATVYIGDDFASATTTVNGVTNVARNTAATALLDKIPRGDFMGNNGSAPYATFGGGGGYRLMPTLTAAQQTAGLLRGMFTDQ